MKIECGELILSADERDTIDEALTMLKDALTSRPEDEALGRLTRRALSSVYYRLLALELGLDHGQGRPARMDWLRSAAGRRRHKRGWDA